MDVAVHLIIVDGVGCTPICLLPVHLIPKWEKMKEPLEFQLPYITHTKKRLVCLSVCKSVCDT